MVSKDTLLEELGDEVGLVEYANVLYVSGEKVVATTRSGALEDLLEQLKLGYETADTVNAYFVEEVDIRQEYVESSYVMNLGYIAEILNETEGGRGDVHRHLRRQLLQHRGEIRPERGSADEAEPRL